MFDLSRRSMALPLYLFCVVALLQAGMPNVNAEDAPVGAKPPATGPAWSSDYPAALAKAEAEKKMILMDIVPDGNAAEGRYENETFTDSGIQGQLQQAILLKINPDASDEAKSLASRYQVTTYPTLLVVNYKGIVVAQESGFRVAPMLKPFLDQYLDLFKKDPLGGIPNDFDSDTALTQALQNKPGENQLPEKILYYGLLDQCEITIQKDGSSHSIERRCLYMANPDLARNGNDVSGVSVRYDTSRERVRYVYARLFDSARQPHNFDFALITDKPYLYPDNVSWNERRLIAPSERAKQDEILDYVVEKDSTPLVPGHFEFVWPDISDHYRAVYNKLIIHFPQELGLIKTSLNGNQVVHETKTPDGMVTWEYDITTLPKRSDGIFSASSLEQSSGCLFHTPWTWDNLADWFGKLSIGRDQLPQDATDLVAQLKSQNADNKDLAFSIYRWVVDNINFCNIYFESSSYQAHPVNEIFNNRCGDVKDECQLLNSLFREAGLSSHIVLTKVGYGGRIDQSAPMIMQFNHCMVSAQIDGQDMYFDPEAPGSFRAGWLPINDSNIFGLKIDDSKGVIVKLPDYRPFATDIAISENIVLQPDGSATCSNHYQYKGAFMSRVKAYIAKFPPDKMREGFGYLFSKDNMTLTDFSIINPTEKNNVISINCALSAPHFATLAGNELTLTLGKNSLAVNWSSYLSDQRTEPYRFYPDDPHVYQYDLSLPPGARLVSKIDDYHFETPFLVFSRTHTLVGNKLSMIDTYYTKDCTIPAEQADDVRDAFQKMQDNQSVSFTIELPGVPPPSSELPSHDDSNNPAPSPPASSTRPAPVD